MTDAASRVRIVLAALPGLLYRITTPAGSGLAPRVTDANGRIRAALLPTGADGPDEVLIVLNRDVRWDIRLPLGAGEQQLDLRRGRVTRVDLGASGLVEMSLPAPAGTVPVTLGGPVGSVVVGAGAGVPLRLTLGAGAGEVRTPWGESLAAAPGSVVQAPGWISSVRRYAVSARAPVGRVLVRGPF